MSRITRAPRRRRYSINRVKRSASYDAYDIAKLFGIHRNTVRHWLREGLTPIDDRRPTLVYGAVLVAFLAERQQARRRKCALGEFYCFKCRAPRKPWGDTADATTHTAKIVRLAALCSICETAMHKSIRRTDVPRLATVIEIRPVAGERLNDCSRATVNSDS